MQAAPTKLFEDQIAFKNYVFGIIKCSNKFKHLTCSLRRIPLLWVSFHLETNILESLLGCNKQNDGGFKFIKLSTVTKKFVRLKNFVLG